jgi:hypothetical protein
VCHLCDTKKVEYEKHFLLDSLAYKFGLIDLVDVNHHDQYRFININLNL